MLANVYIPPPFCTEILYELMKFIIDKSGAPVIVMGDFNMTMDKSLDRFLLGISPGGTSSSPLLQFCGKTGLTDVLRRWYPGARQYSCHSRTHATLSRIDLILCNEEALNIVEEVKYQLR